MTGWDEYKPPNRTKIRRMVAKHKSLVEFEVTTKTKLKVHTKPELVEEIHRLQTLVRDLAVTLGIARRTKSSEYTIDMSFTADIASILKSGWSRNL